MKKMLKTALVVALITFGLCFLIALFPDVFLKGWFYQAVETYACPILDIIILVAGFSGVIAILVAINKIVVLLEKISKERQA